MLLATLRTYCNPSQPIESSKGPGLIVDIAYRSLSGNACGQYSSEYIESPHLKCNLDIGKVFHLDISWDFRGHRPSLLARLGCRFVLFAVGVLGAVDLDMSVPARRFSKFCLTKGAFVPFTLAFRTPLLVRSLAMASEFHKSLENVTATRGRAGPLKIFWAGEMVSTTGAIMQLLVERR